MPGKRPRLIARSPSIARLCEQQPLKQCHAVAPDATEDPAWHSSQLNHPRCGCIPPVDFLDSCFFCRRPLGQGLDIFMYRGDRAFCSVECRHHQIVLDERKENFRRIALKKVAPTPSSRLPNENGRKVAQSGTTSAA